VAKLEADEIRKWHREIAKTPARCGQGADQRKHIAQVTSPSPKQSESGKHQQIAVWAY
jgi:hypothetical protein